MDQTLRVSEGAVEEAFAARRAPGRALAGAAEEVARACHDMALRFHRGGKLIVFGNGGPSTDAQHISVEFVHPVIVGKRALPAISLTNDIATITGIANREGFEEVFSHQLRHLAAAEDIALGVSSDGRCANVLRGFETAKAMELLTIALVGGDGGEIARSPAVDHALRAASDDPRIVKEIHVTTYHILWELVHVFFEQPGVLDPGVVG
jgi:D-sedoheptulose 7-phosphate isomerase